MVEEGDHQSLIGKPLYIDIATARKERIEYARCFVEIDASDPLPKEVSLAILNGGEINIPVEYKWVPPKFPNCACF